MNDELTTVWVVSDTSKRTWELGGVFTTEQAAREACTETNDGYWPVPVNQWLGRETTIVTPTFPVGSGS